MKSILLINHPTVKFSIRHIAKRDDIQLGNTYRYTMPISLVRVATILENDLGVKTEILDMKASYFAKEVNYRKVKFNQMTATLHRVGLDMDILLDHITKYDAVGLSNHFTFESGIVKEIIHFCRKHNPKIKVLVGGADVKARPNYYLECGADLAFLGDINPNAILEADWSKPKIIQSYRYPIEKLNKPDFNKLSDLKIYTDSHDGPVPQGVTTPVGFTYFTRGCPRECDFCESRRTKFEALPIDHALEMLTHYSNHGIKTINFSDDNFLLLKRPYIETLLTHMRRLKFAWEFPNGLEVGRFIRNGEVDRELISLLFSNYKDHLTGQHIGAYRAFIPVETFEKRANYKKLKPVNEQNAVIKEIITHNIPEINFGVVLPPNAKQSTFDAIHNGYKEIKKILNENKYTKSRFSIFHLIPIALHRSMKTLRSVDDFPEGWNFHFPIYNGTHLTAEELFINRIETIMKIDPAAHHSMMNGIYSYA
ncbi:cobalamin-dependent protein [Polycladidibacter stylochi]|uniref:cobalamin-dependent protein n=1 Tax=Polycladidibacter stylochi TaxID=1807766 RepID=UPI0008361192|nr:cobalamin-dependent protein [Pseudovibrio stylochi]